jgi:hypothetical protein
MRRAIPFLLVVLAVVPVAAESARALRDVRGVVETVTSEARADSTRWTVVAVRTTEGEIVRVGLASEEVMESEAFVVAVGDPVRVRFFADGDPHEAQRIRNEATGRVLRIRCLHGDPLWRENGDRHRFRQGGGGPRGSGKGASPL